MTGRTGAVREWQRRFGKQRRKDAKSAFIEVGSEAAPILGHQPGEMVAEVRDSNGTTVRLCGSELGRKVTFPVCRPGGLTTRRTLESQMP